MKGTKTKIGENTLPSINDPLKTGDPHAEDGD
jgi:hypothetical protein